ncbi:hypothetical protein SODALDRAFT_73271 [Sodiomyces alkalinus F11]|uniref:Uncharacterized protein n=1 Tax=Sodiomyces alkalinus (strain CBS 110278 / VKM F-3762 / F11) TaxID=1314773 RepID=A0A3N2PK39_SODAK|nr:hypothetical protein SODALDRAFT_73271 [Sodiomyces alkalinus F11]ROT34891.1 hypothetical protein SODALDRAFT_73271 [Sodiomyces alkalinus F11]
MRIPAPLYQLPSATPITYVVPALPGPTINGRCVQVPYLEDFFAGLRLGLMCCFGACRHPHILRLPPFPPDGRGGNDLKQVRLQWASTCRHSGLRGSLGPFGGVRFTHSDLKVHLPSTLSDLTPSPKTRLAPLRSTVAVVALFFPFRVVCCLSLTSLPSAPYIFFFFFLSAANSLYLALAAVSLWCSSSSSDLFSFLSGEVWRH